MNHIFSYTQAINQKNVTLTKIYVKKRCNLYDLIPKEHPQKTVYDKWDEP